MGGDPPSTPYVRRRDGPSTVQDSIPGSREPVAATTDPRAHTVVPGLPGVAAALSSSELHARGQQEVNFNPRPPRLHQVGH